MKTDLTKDDVFHVWQPAAVEIAKGASEEDRRIGGFCSTEALDRQKEIVFQKGLDFTDFVNFGYFNDNHNQATAAVVGVPDEAKYVPGKGWYTEGKLLKGFARADEIWNLAKSLAGTKRRLGFSIEGKVIERRDNMIVKASIRNVAVTNCPVNPNCTWDVLAKSFAPVDKALSVGADRSASTGGRVLVPEDLEHDEKCPSCGRVHSSVKKCRKSELSADEAVALLRTLRPGFSEAVCRRIYSLACKER